MRSDDHSSSTPRAWTCDDLLTEEPKLSAAWQIISEWTDYDDETTCLSGQIKADAAVESAGSSTVLSSIDMPEHVEL